MSIFRHIIPLMLLLPAITGCQRGVIYSHTIPVSPEGWRSDDFVKFEMLVTDTLTPHSLDVHIRNDGRYGFSNLFLFVTTTAPTGVSIKDTIECTLADPSGKWLGRGTGGQFQHTIPYKYQVIFPYSGKYVIEIEHGMRTDPLPYIRDVGITIKAEE